MKSELVLTMHIIYQNAMKHYEIQPCNNYYAALEEGNLIELDNECP